MIKGRQELVTTQNVKQIQRLILSPQMQQALHLLQLPVLELRVAIEEELTQNPMLEISDSEMLVNPEECEILRTLEDVGATSTYSKSEDEDINDFIENTVSYVNSLYAHLMQQASETFNHPCELKLAEALIGNLDHDGILTTPLEEIAALEAVSLEELLEILFVIQSFDPPGVGARNAREALLIQLKNLGKEDGLAFKIIEHHFDEVMHNKIPHIAKALKSSISDVRNAIVNEIACLDLHPGTSRAEGHYKPILHHVTPDLTISYEYGNFSIVIHDEHVPSLRLNRKYIHLLQSSDLSEETASYIQEKIASGKWLLRNLHERHQTLYRIAEQLVQNQKEFFIKDHGQLVPLTMKEIAEKLELHESTVARAVANKYLHCNRGILPLRSFFTHAYETDSGEQISSHTVKDLLTLFLSQEDKTTPLSDEALSLMIKEKGIPCARRTVAKYRQELNIGNTTQRRLHKEV